MSNTFTPHQTGPAAWARTRLSKYYRELGIGAVHAALMCRRFGDPVKDTSKIAAWHAAPNMSGILAGVAES